MFKRVTFSLLLLSFSASAEPLSRWSRFVCDSGFSYFNDKYVVSFFQTESYEVAREKLGEIEEIHEKLLNDKRNFFFNEYKIGIIKDLRSGTFHVVDQICYANRSISSAASVNAYMIGQKFNLKTQVMEVHTGRISSSGDEDKDYYELIYDGQHVEYSGV